LQIDAEASLQGFGCQMWLMDADLLILALNLLAFGVSAAPLLLDRDRRPTTTSLSPAPATPPYAVGLQASP
jgi:hypothetical protein